MSITLTPAAPVVGVAVALSTDAAGNRFEWYLTATPMGSALPLGPIVSSVTPDVAGNYSVAVYAYAAAASGLQDGKRLLSTASTTFYVTDALELEVAGAGHAAKLRVAFGGADLVSSAVWAAPSDDAARIASESTSLAALQGVSSTTLGPDLVAATATLRTAWNTHLASATYHYFADTVNAVTSAAPTTVQSAIVTLNELRSRALGHLRGVSGGLGVLGGGNWHGADDTSNLYIVAPASDLASAVVLYADLRARVLTGHFALAAIHKAADTTSTLPAATPLDAAAGSFLTSLASQSVTAPAGEQQGAVDAVFRFGFSKVT